MVCVEGVGGDTWVRGQTDAINQIQTVGREIDYRRASYSDWSMRLKALEIAIVHAWQRRGSLLVHGILHFSRPEEAVVRIGVEVVRVKCIDFIRASGDVKHILWGSINGYTFDVQDLSCDLTVNFAAKKPAES